MNQRPRAATVWQRAVQGAVLGLIATKPMSDFMGTADAAPVDSNWSSLPPRAITHEVLQLIGIKRRLKSSQQQQAIRLSHYGYGAVLGTLYGALQRSSSSLPAALTRGAGFGLGVWVASYFGWLPAVDSSAAGTRQSVRKNVTMVIAHLIWGSTLGAAYAAITTLQGTCSSVDSGVAVPGDHDSASTPPGVSEQGAITSERASRT